MKTRKLLLTLLACSAFLVPGRAQAQSSDHQALFTEAQEAIAARNWDDARRVLMTLWANDQTYDVALSLGQVEIQLQRHADAANHIAFGLRKMPPSQGAELARRGRELLDVAKQHVGTARISVTKANAEIRVDSVLIGTSPLESEWFLEPGKHVVQARLADGAVAEKTIDVRAGLTLSVDLDPRQEPSRAAEPSPPANGAAEAKEEGIEPRTVVLIAGGALTGVALTTAIVFAAKSASAEDEASRLRTELGPTGCSNPTFATNQTCSELASVIDDRNSANKIETISWIATGVFAAGTTAAFFLWPKDDREAGVKVRILPIAAPNSVALAASGQF